MTKTTRTNTNTKTSTSAAGTTPEMAAEEAGRIINDTLDALRPGLEVPVAARDFVAGQAATAQARLEDARKGATELNAQAGNAAMSLAGTYAGFAKTMIDISAANASHALSAAEKLAAAKTMPEAMQIQADFVRDSTSASFYRFRELTETVRQTASEVAATTQDSALKAWSLTRTAA
jgi:hypothetical protein